MYHYVCLCISLDFNQYNLFYPCFFGLIHFAPYTGQIEILLQKIKSKFIHNYKYLFKGNMYIIFLIVLTPNISLIHKNNHICNIAYTP